MVTLSPEQTTKYYAEQGSLPTPLSPTDWLAQQTLPATGAITPQSLTQTNPFPLVTPTPTPTYPVSTLQVPPELTATPQEQKASGISTQLGDLYNSLVGKSADQTAANTQFGVDMAQKNITDLGAQLTGLKNEAAAIPLQLQQESTGRGITTGGLAPIQAARVRTNAIAALGVSTLLAASQGQLANAQAMANRAVAEKYDPILEKITAAKANLDLILNDPLTSLQDKNRANAQRAIQDQKEQQTAQAKTNETETWKIATASAANGNNFVATAQYPSLSLALQAISTAPDPQTALQIATSVGLLQDTVKTTTPELKVLGSATTGYFTYDPATGKTAPLGSAPTPTTKKTPAPAAPYGALSKANITAGTNWIYNNGGTSSDLEKFKTDREFQAWVMGQI